MSYTIVIRCYHNSSFNPVQVKSKTWFGMVWNLIRVWILLKKTYMQSIAKIEMRSEPYSNQSIMGTRDQDNRFIPLVSITTINPTIN
jgi:hypothetical protein